MFFTIGDKSLRGEFNARLALSNRHSATKRALVPILWSFLRFGCLLIHSAGKLMHHLFFVAPLRISRTAISPRKSHSLPANSFTSVTPETRLNGCMAPSGNVKRRLTTVEQPTRSDRR